MWTGNSASYFPGNCAGVVTVAASTRAGALAMYSNLGANIALAAPGGDASDPILALSTDQNATELLVTAGVGTSFSVPHVAGVVGLGLSLGLRITSSNVGLVTQAYEPEEQGFCQMSRCAIFHLLPSVAAP